jgi:hypothetical protein
MIVPLGIGTRYFDAKRSTYSMTFVPFLNLFVKSESKAGTAFAKKVLIEKAKEFLGVDIEVAGGGFDASDAFLGGMAPSKRHFTDYAHVARKIKTETGPTKMKNKDNLKYLSQAIDTLHSCSTCAQFMALAKIVVNFLAARDETEIVEYLTKVLVQSNTKPNTIPNPFLTLIPTPTAPISHA